MWCPYPSIKTMKVLVTHSKIYSVIVQYWCVHTIPASTAGASAFAQKCLSLASLNAPARTLQFRQTPAKIFFTFQIDDCAPSQQLSETECAKPPVGLVTQSLDIQNSVMAASGGVPKGAE